MILYVIRRFINYAILTVIATVLTYMLASSLLNPSSRYYGKNPRPSDDTVNRILSGLGVNPHVPLIERTWHWFTQIILHGSFGDTVSGTTVGHEIMVRSGVSPKLLIAGSLIGAFLGVAFGVWGAVKQYKGSDGVFAKDGKPLTLSITVPVGHRQCRTRSDQADRSRKRDRQAVVFLCSAGHDRTDPGDLRCRQGPRELRRQAVRIPRLHQGRLQEVTLKVDRLIPRRVGRFTYV